MQRSAGDDVIRVVHRVDDAKEDNKLDLSDCHLRQIPDAIYLLLKNTMLTCCNLSQNSIRVLPSKLAIRFSHLNALILCDNQLVTLPDEMGRLTSLKILDISNNSFRIIPQVLYGLPKLKSLHAEKNIIIGIDLPKLVAMPQLALVDLQQNPLPDELYVQLEGVTNIKILLTHRELEEFDDVD